MNLINNINNLDPFLKHCFLHTCVHPICTHSKRLSIFIYKFLYFFRNFIISHYNYLNIYLILIKKLYKNGFI
ncbi:hypothetical protein HanXRQr2_Chr02g0055181 [Helianthus annuus]|uniref:Uncharacterized protein n=1 Tax=Helianthus annuus TaxID=4232 RepID=A0A9K3JM14_HELAN|nr:hypothetical protein HanXRQr2_Chr02g0055181 [Helianthus annuus]